MIMLKHGDKINANVKISEQKMDRSCTAISDMTESSCFYNDQILILLTYVAR